MKNWILFFITFLTFSFRASAQFDQDHSLLNEVLKLNVEKKGHQTFVHYKKIKENPTTLMSYLKLIEEVHQNDFNNFSKAEKLAFWINSYNAYTIKLIIDHYPIKSIKDIELM